MFNKSFSVLPACRADFFVLSQCLCLSIIDACFLKLAFEVSKAAGMSIARLDIVKELLEEAAITFGTSNVKVAVPGNE